MKKAIVAVALTLAVLASGAANAKMMSKHDMMMKKHHHMKHHMTMKKKMGM